MGGVSSFKNKVVRVLSTWDEASEQSLLKLREEGLTVKEVAEKLTEEYGREFTYWSVQKKVSRLKKHSQHLVEDKGYKETLEITPDGTHKSDKLLRMSEEQKKDVNYLLKAHGYDVNEWELISARNNIWNSYSKQDGIMTMYASKITVKPRENKYDIKKLLESIKETPSVNITPTYIPTNNKQYLLIPLFDMHFGISDYDYYKETQSKIVDMLQRGYEEVLIIIGQDLLHTDDFRGRTSSGREIGKVDVVKAWNDAKLFFYPIIEYALKRSNKVKVIYSKGNHSETLEWAFVQMVKERFKQVVFDDEFKERKVHLLGYNFVGFNHGDKKKEQNLSENFATEFPIEWSKSKTRTIFTGHLHSERVIDKGGILIRRMPTRNKIDDYHDDNGYTTAHKRFQVHEFNEDEQTTIYYV